MKPHRSYLHFRQSFITSLRTAKGIWTERTSLILREDDGFGNISFGEIAPLLGDYDSNLSMAEKEANVWIEGNNSGYEFKSLLPAIQSLESFVWKKVDGISNLPASAKLWGFSESISSGVVKRKIGILPHKEEIPVILDWLNTLSPDVQVRLDPNESFSRDDLMRWTDALLHKSSIQYIEQPTGIKDDEWLIDHSLVSPLPIALDEALLRMRSCEDLLKLPKNLFLVIKPTLFNNWKILNELCADTSRKVIFSTVFESPFGYEALIRISSQSSFNPGLDRKCYLGNAHEFPEHHFPKLTSPSVTNLKLASFWDHLKL